MTPSSLPLFILAGPLVIALAILLLPARVMSLRACEAAHVVSMVLVFALALAMTGQVLGGARLEALASWLYVDSLGAIFLMIIAVVGLMTGLYSLGYIRHDIEVGHLDMRRAKIYYGFFNLFVFTMLLSATANNIVMMWVAVEATTLGSAFLVGIYGEKTSLEAAWKYVVICTVGVAFGLYGTVLVFSNGSEVLADPHQAVLWTSLAQNAASLDPSLMKIAFVFVVIGFGTKAGLFPMHAWLPDAHSEAPSPVSALLSGVLLKCALFVIIRYLALMVRAIGPEFPQTLLLTLGVLSVVVAAMLFFVQKDLKRKLAYSSVEHVGLIAIGLGLGGPLGVAAALLHSINHSLAKALLFCGSGNVLMKYGTRDLDKVKGMLRLAPASGLLLMIGALALSGFPPFNVFVSEFLVFAAGLKAGHPWLMLVCLLFFTVTIAGFIQIISGSVLGKTSEGAKPGDVSAATLVPLGILAALVLVMGFAVPAPIAKLVADASAIVLDGGDPVTVASPWQFGGTTLFADDNGLLATPAAAAEPAAEKETK
ncbi:hydrogenase 4 subunit F [Consotaella salsifontis]|uniref:Hydrogenase-4 component F n=1 Tax=Consotaella salsifontis TaxID=1365950 RepID=A0A1T4RN70_9HYPH|nr:hydrogenase 4 subunit F [Consotaella salsifontis]SKA17412.1 hydrogenase-4 component F [Consotaella salsifontis]